MYHVASVALVQLVVCAVSVLLSCVFSIVRGMKVAITLIATETIMGVPAKMLTLTLTMALVVLILLALPHRVQMRLS